METTPEQGQPPAKRLKVGVCEAPAELWSGSREWNDICRRVSREAPDLFLLNEMPFGPWFASRPVFDAGVWNEACLAHERALDTLDALGAAVVAGTRPRDVDGQRVNEGFLWTRGAGLAALHTKQHFPDEPGYFEARWFSAGRRRHGIGQAGHARVGFQICTEVMFNEHARRYGRGGCQVILAPRAVGRESLRRWKVAMRMTAIVSGCYVLSSNRNGADDRGQQFGGTGWIVDPNGDMVGQTSCSTPVVFHELNLDWVADAQTQYPCYLPE